MRAVENENTSIAAFCKSKKRNTIERIREIHPIKSDHNFKNL